MAATRKATSEKAGINMKRYEEILERFEKCDDGDEEKREAISKLHDEALKDGEKWFLG